MAKAASWQAGVLFFNPHQRILAVSRQPSQGLMRNQDWWIPCDKPRNDKEEPFNTALRALSEQTGQYTMLLRPVITIPEEFTAGLGLVHVYTPAAPVYGGTPKHARFAAGYIDPRRFLNNVVDPRKNMYLANSWLLRNALGWPV